MGIISVLGGVLKGNTQKRHQQGPGTRDWHPRKGLLPSPPGAGWKSPTRGEGVHREGAGSRGCDEGSGDPGPGDKRGYKIFGKEENGWMSQVRGGHFPIGIGYPCFSGNHAERSTLPEKAFQVPCFGVTRVV